MKNYGQEMPSEPMSMMKKSAIVIASGLAAASIPLALVAFSHNLKKQSGILDAEAFTAIDDVGATNGRINDIHAGICEKNKDFKPSCMYSPDMSKLYSCHDSFAPCLKEHEYQNTFDCQTKAPERVINKICEKLNYRFDACLNYERIIADECVIREATVRNKCALEVENCMRAQTAH